VNQRTFLTIEEVLMLHAAVIAQFGGEPAVLSLDLLESAVAMPQARFEGEFFHESLAAMAAAYLFHLCKDHPFVDGNKRTALAAAEIFLDLNGARLRATNAELERLTRRVAEGQASKADVVRFLEERVTQD
jgi:death-on-curing protein